MKRKDLLGLDGVSREEITSILDTALMMRQVVRSNNKKTAHLQGKSIVTLFYENSTRTRMSFELASQIHVRRGGEYLRQRVERGPRAKRSSDTGVTLDQMGTDVIIIRHPMSGAPTLLAKHVKASVINAGDGMNEHPTQALLDMLTMREHLGGLEGAKVAICGDVMHSRVARSNIYGLTTMGAKVVLCAPPTLIPPRMDELGCAIAPTIEDACENADVVMGLRIQRERQQKGLFPSVAEYCDHWEITPERLALAKKDALVMHPRSDEPRRGNRFERRGLRSVGHHSTG